MGCGEFLQCLMLIGGLKLWIVVVGLLAGTIADSQWCVLSYAGCISPSLSPKPLPQGASPSWSHGYADIVNTLKNILNCLRKFVWLLAFGMCQIKQSICVLVVWSSVSTWVLLALQNHHDWVLSCHLLLENETATQDNQFSSSQTKPKNVVVVAAFVCANICSLL